VSKKNVLDCHLVDTYYNNSWSSKGETLDFLSQKYHSQPFIWIADWQRLTWYIIVWQIDFRWFPPWSIAVIITKKKLSSHINDPIQAKKEDKWPKRNNHHQFYFIGHAGSHHIFFSIIRVCVCGSIACITTVVW